MNVICIFYFSIFPYNPLTTTVASFFLKNNRLRGPGAYRRNLDYNITRLAPYYLREGKFKTRLMRRPDVDTSHRRLRIFRKVLFFFYETV